MAGKGWIDTSGSSPRLKAGAAASGLLATLIVGWFDGGLTLLDAVGGGITSTLDGATQFVGGYRRSPGLIGLLVDGAVGMIDAGIAANVRFISSLGPLGYVAGLIEGMLLVALVVWTIQTALSRLRQGVP